MAMQRMRNLGVMIAIAVLPMALHGGCILRGTAQTVAPGNKMKDPATKPVAATPGVSQKAVQKPEAKTPANKANTLVIGLTLDSQNFWLFCK